MHSGYSRLDLEWIGATKKLPRFFEAFCRSFEIFTSFRNLINVPNRGCVQFARGQGVKLQEIYIEIGFEHGLNNLYTSINQM